MNGSLRSASRGLAVCAGVLFALAAGGAAGQEDDEPLRLIPLQQEEPGEADAPPASEDAATSEPAAGDEFAPPAGDGIVVGTLDAIEPEPPAIGIPLPGMEPFPVDSWSGARPERIVVLMARLPAASPSPAMRRLALRLLASPAHPPEGSAPGAFAALRAGRLAAMGARDHAAALLARPAAGGTEEAVARLEIDRLLAALDYDAACRQVADMMSRSRDFHWRRALVLCQAQAGRLEAATLGLELLHESDAPPDPAFDDTIRAMAGLTEPAIDGLGAPTPLLVAALRLAQIPIPAAAVAAAAPDLLPAIAGAPESPPRTRLLAAERAEAVGTLPVETLRRIYREMAFSPDERADALRQLDSLEPPLGRALMLQSVEAEENSTTRAELLAAALSLAEEGGAYGTMARVLAELVRTIPVAPEYAWFGGTAGRALIAAEDRAAADAWHGLLVERAPFDEEAAGAKRRLRPLTFLRGSQDGSAEESPPTRLAWEAAPDDAGLPARAHWLAVLLDSLGYEVAPTVWDRLLADDSGGEARGPAPALAHALRAAAGNNRLGETASLALIALGEGGPAAADLATAGLVVAGLAAVGLREDARAIALEAALAAGL